MSLFAWNAKKIILIFFYCIRLFGNSPFRNIVVFLKWLFIGYFRLGYIVLGDCPTGLGAMLRKGLNTIIFIDGAGGFSQSAQCT